MVFKLLLALNLDNGFEVKFFYSYHSIGLLMNLIKVDLHEY